MFYMHLCALFRYTHMWRDRDWWSWRLHATMTSFLGKKRWPQTVWCRRDVRRCHPDNSVARWDALAIDWSALLAKEVQSHTLAASTWHEEARTKDAARNWTGLRVYKHHLDHISLKRSDYIIGQTPNSNRFKKWNHLPEWSFYIFHLKHFC